MAKATWMPWASRILPHYSDILLTMLGLAFRIGAFVVGVALILLGILGLFLPFLQGILLIALGLSVMSMVSPRVAAWVDRVKDRARGLWERRRRDTP